MKVWYFPLISVWRFYFKIFFHLLLGISICYYMYIYSYFYQMCLLSGGFYDTIITCFAYLHLLVMYRICISGCSNLHRLQDNIYLSGRICISLSWMLLCLFSICDICLIQSRSPFASHVTVVTLWLFVNFRFI